MEVSCQIDHFCDVVIRVLVVCCVLDAADKVDKVLVCDRELLQKTILLEETEAKVNQHVIAQDIAVLKDVKVPLFKFVHNLENVGPLACIGINHLSEAFLIFFQLSLVYISILPMQLLQIVVKVLLKPLSCVTCLLCRDHEPGFSLHILITFTCLIERQLVQSTVLNNLSNIFRLLFNWVGDWQILELPENCDHWVNWVVLFCVPKTGLIACDAPNSNHYDSDQTEHTKALESNSSYHKHPGDHDNRCIK